MYLSFICDFLKYILNSTELKYTQNIKLYCFVHTILSVPFCPIPFCLYTILSIPLCPYHFVRYHFIRSPYIYIYIYIYICIYIYIHVLGNAPSYLLEHFTLTSACFDADLSAPHPRGTLWCRVLALPPDRKGLSRLWVSLFGMVSPLTFVLCLGTFPVLFINSSRLSSLAGPGLGALLSSYLEGALYKLIYR